MPSPIRMSAPLLTPELAPSLLEELERAEPFMVVLFNDDLILFDTVIEALMRATGCDEEEAELEANEAHQRGHTPCHYAGESECREVQEVLSAEGITAEVRKEWVE